MADSDNTTTLPSVTCEQRSVDTALVLSLAWIDAHTSSLASCIRQQEAEQELLESGGLLPAGEVIGRGEGTCADRSYLDARKAEQDDAEKAEALLAEIASTPAQSLAGVVAKLAVIVREADDNSDLCEFPLPHIRSTLADLRRLTDDAIGNQPAGWPAGNHSVGSLFEQPASSFAAWRAFGAWSQGDEKAYRAWTTTFKTLQGVSQ